MRGHLRTLWRGMGYVPIAALFVAGLLAPFLAGLFVITLVAGQGHVAHFAHFLAFLFGGAMEATYVFSGHEEEEEPSERTLPKRVGW